MRGARFAREIRRKQAPVGSVYSRESASGRRTRGSVSAYAASRAIYILVKRWDDGGIIAGAAGDRINVF